MNREELFSYKPYLFTIAYNMLGDITVAEDLVQDTFEKWLQTERADVVQPKAYLSRILINKAIDCLEQEKKKRETYKGLWLPEPILSEVATTEENQTLEYALLFLLERLNPYERAVFVLKEVFSFSYSEISDFLNLSQENCRQLLHRAKEKVQVSRKKQEIDLAKHTQLLEAFLTAVYQRDFAQLKQILRDDVVMYQDGGGKVAAALKPLFGTDKVTRFLEGIMGLDLNTDAPFRVTPVYLNGVPAVLIYRDEVLDTVFYSVAEGDNLAEVYFVRNPDKIRINL